MAYGSNYFSVITVLHSLLTVTFSGKYTKVYYADEFCGERITVDGDARIQLSKSEDIGYDRRCEVELVGLSGKLVATFLKYSVSHKVFPDHELCPVEQFELYDENNVKLRVRYQSGDFCTADIASMKPLHIGNVGILKFAVRGATKIEVGAVDMLLTVTIPKDICPEKPDQYFLCEEAKFCVGVIVTCNGFDNCGDNKDEATCGSSVVSAEGSLAFLALICIMAL